MKFISSGGMKSENVCALALALDLAWSYKRRRTRGFALFAHSIFVEKDRRFYICKTKSGEEKFILKKLAPEQKKLKRNKN